MKAKFPIYWVCQVAGWGVCSLVGLWIAAQQRGWQPSVVASFLLYFLYSIALTDLLRRRMEREHWLTAPWRKAALRCPGAAVTIGSIQAFLIVPVDLVFEGRRRDFAHIGAVLAAIFGTTLGTATD